VIRSLDGLETHASVSSPFSVVRCRRASRGSTLCRPGGLIGRDGEIKRVIRNLEIGQGPRWQSRPYSLWVAQRALGFFPVGVPPGAFTWRYHRKSKQTRAGQCPSVDRASRIDPYQRDPTESGRQVVPAWAANQRRDPKKRKTAEEKKRNASTSNEHVRVPILDLEQFDRRAIPKDAAVIEIATVCSATAAHRFGTVGGGNATPAPGSNNPPMNTFWIRRSVRRVRHR